MHLNILSLVCQEHICFSGVGPNFFGVPFEKRMKGMDSQCLDSTHTQKVNKSQEEHIDLPLSKQDSLFTFL